MRSSSLIVRLTVSFLAVVGYASFWAWFHSARLRGKGGVGLSLVNSSSTTLVRVDDLIRDAVLSVASSSRQPDDLERAALLGAKTFREVRGDAWTKNRKPLLCATFTTSDREALKRVLENMRQMREHCEWAVLFYDLTSDHSAIRLLEHTALQEGLAIAKAEVVPTRQTVLETHGIDLAVQAAKLTAYSDLNPILRKALLDDDNFRSSFSDRGQARHRRQHLTNANRSSHNALVYPKSLQFLSLLPLLPRYQRVWLLDADISLQGFRADRFLLVVDCAFERPPLVAQPLIAEHTQSYKFLNAAGWEKAQLDEQGRSGRGAGFLSRIFHSQTADGDEVANTYPKNVLATASAFLEIQAPLLDSAFFEWFLRFLVVPMAAPSHILGADWGFDALFCRAAAAFSAATAAEGEAAAAGNRDKGEPCVLVVAGTPVHHVDRRDLDATLGRDVKKVLNRALMRIIASSFPSLYKSGHDKDANMLLPEHAAKYRRSDKFLGRDLKCTHRRPKMRPVDRLDSGLGLDP